MHLFNFFPSQYFKFTGNKIAFIYFIFLNALPLFFPQLSAVVVSRSLESSWNPVARSRLLQVGFHP